MKYILLLTTLFLYSCTTCVPDEKYNCNREGYSVDYAEEVIDERD